MVTLRPYQTQLVDMARSSVAQGHRRLLVVLPTGGGKTFVMADVAQRAVELGGRVLCLMHLMHLIIFLIVFGLRYININNHGYRSDLNARYL